MSLRITSIVSLGSSVLAACVALTGAPRLAPGAAIIIDNFDKGGVPFFTNDTTTWVSRTDNTPPATDTIGGQRIVSIAKQPNNSSTDGTSAQINQGAANDTTGSFGVFKLVTLARGNGRLQYGQTNPLNADLNNDDYDSFRLVFSDGGNYDGFIELASALGTGNEKIQEVPFTVPGGLGGAVELPFSSFNTINFDDVDRITLTFAANQASQDLQLDLFRTAIALPTPEPSSIGLAMVGAALLLRRRRRRAV
jgi:hypothetical protein